MSYPSCGETYLERIQKDKDLCKEIRRTFFVLRMKEAKLQDCDVTEIDLAQQFVLLYEAFFYNVDDIYETEDYHFMYDILDALLGEEE